MKNKHIDRNRRAARWLACALLAVAGSVAAAPVALPILAQESIEPKWIFGDGRPQGLCPDLLDALEKQEPRLRFIRNDIGRSLPSIERALASGNAGAACALIDSPYRRGLAIRIGKPLYTIRERLAAAADDDAVIRNIADLARLKALVNVTRGSAFTAYLRERGVEVDDSTGNQALTLRKVLAGHGRFAFINEMTLERYIRSEHLEGKIKILPAVMKEEQVYFWISHHADPAAVQLVERTLARIRASGELNRIVERWARSN